MKAATPVARLAGVTEKEQDRCPNSQAEDAR
jgi:hypothetical protein